MKYLILIILFVASFNTAFSQSSQPYRKNVIMLDAAGPIAAGVGVGYERYLSLKSQFKPTARAGVGLVNDFQHVSGYVGSSILWGRTSNIELGINYLFQYDRDNFDWISENESQFGNGYQVIIGYRYQSEKGFLLRIYWVTPIGCCGSCIPVYGGLGLGWGF